MSASPRKRDGRDEDRGPPVNVNDLVSLKVDNIPTDCRKEVLEEAFSRYGEVGDVYVPVDRWTRSTKGYAFVRFYNKEDAQRAIDKMDGAELQGRKISCAIAQYGRDDRPSRDSGKGWGGKGKGYGGKGYGGYGWYPPYGGGYGYYGGGGGGRDRSYSRSRSRDRRRRTRSSPRR